MKEFFLSISAIIVILLAYGYYKNGKEFLRGVTAKGVLSGIIISFVAVSAIVLFSGCSSVQLFSGIENTNKISPMCANQDPSPRLTSNLGLKGCSILSKDGRTIGCGVYRHHSCAISPDRYSYDAIGVEITRVLWSKD